MCLHFLKKTYKKDNKQEHIGYKVFMKEKSKYYNPHYTRSVSHIMGETYKDKKASMLLFAYSTKDKSNLAAAYENGFHVYATKYGAEKHIKETLWGATDAVIIKVKTCNICAIGEQNYCKTYVVKQYTMIKEV